MQESLSDALRYLSKGVSIARSTGRTPFLSKRTDSHGQDRKVPRVRQVLP